MTILQRLNKLTPAERRRLLLARISNQRGRVQFHHGSWSVLYWIRDLSAPNGWHRVRESLNADSLNLALHEAARILTHVNERNQPGRAPSRPPTVKEDNTGDFADCELAWTNLPGAVRKLKWRWNGMLQEDPTRKDPRYYPTQKPIALMKWCIARASITSVLDPFMGSGSTLRAAKDVGIDAIGIDACAEACEIAARRLAQEVLPLASSK